MDVIDYILQQKIVTLIPFIVWLLICRTLSQKQLMARHLSSLLAAVCKVSPREGANPLGKDNNGQDSLYHASSQDADFLDLLQSHMANSESTAFFMFV